jgi:hypothetical protein
VEIIDWPAISTTREKSKFHQRKWASKWAAEIIPVRSVMQDRGLWETAACPRGCGEELETPSHVVECPCAAPLWTKIQQILFEWAAKANAKPGLLAAITTGISQWCTGEPLLAMDQWDEEIKDAFCSQSHFGWEAALKGFLTKKWQLI